MMRIQVLPIRSTVRFNLQVARDVQGLGNRIFIRIRLHGDRTFGFHVAIRNKGIRDWDRVVTDFCLHRSRGFAVRSSISLRIRERRIARDHHGLTRNIGEATSVVAPLQRLGHRNPSPAIFIAAEQEASATLTAEGVRGETLEKLLATDTPWAPPVSPYLVDVQTSILGHCQSSRPTMRIPGKA